MAKAPQSDRTAGTGEFRIPRVPAGSQQLFARGEGISILAAGTSTLSVPVSLELQMFALNQGLRNVARQWILDLR